MSVKRLLLDAGLLVKVRGIGHLLEDQYGCYEVLLPEAEVEEGHSIIIKKTLM